MLLLAVLVSAACLRSQTPPPVMSDGRAPAFSAEDSQVFAAVIEQMILPRLLRWGDARSLRIGRQTVALCSDPAKGWGCYREESLEFFWGRDDGKNLGAVMIGTTLVRPGAVVADAITRMRLNAALMERNQRPTRLPPFRVPNVRLVFVEGDRPLAANIPFFGEFGFPGYVDDRALVYAGYVCETCGGEGWLLVLTKDGGRWIVRSGARLWEI
jgi:hypothetical protein